MIRKICCLFLLLVVYSSCQKSKAQKSVYPNHVGDTAFDEKIDDPNFKVCTTGRIPQYYEFGKSLQFKGEKPAIDKHFEILKQNESTAESGYITIRFIVNCEGKTGRYRIEEMSNDYQPMSFDKNLVEKILTLTKELSGWIVGGNPEQPVDYYQYLTFKIEGGKLIEIMP
ncbi:MAG: hypothetical protein ING84_09865 [Cytophagales bacterium]|nr:hypothetical protein [Cytophagales bacterium]MCA6366281.1 hypothetical protein [Cytophagales bacterium]MCA6371964.1 hypothetical protein [Cytophagales bacterium]MCA6376672.1 hypothetical protein [Cytophagales bacterium]MCA6383712.1 hypothetical protein [Cytophagales bacterium]